MFVELMLPVEEKLKGSIQDNVENDKRGISQWIVICLVFALFTLFLFMKVEGYFDYTGRYGIEWINESELNNGVMMIDDDIETTWGILGNFEKGSTVIMKFRNIRSFSEISILNASDYPSIPVSVCVSDTGEVFTLCDNVAEERGDRTVYKLSDTLTGRFLMLIYEADEIGHWPITEVEIYE